VPAQRASKAGLSVLVDGGSAMVAAMPLRTWGDQTTTVRLESRFDKNVIDALRNAGHPVRMVKEYSDLMERAVAISRHADGASDPRSDGSAAWF
jgi:gamma-glutamyltranspeptidase/glutathione hydrolase